MAKGTIYFIQGGGDGRIKIGFTVDLPRRLTSMRTGSPVPLAVLATCEGDAIDEQRLHQRFAAHRIRGEWFEPAEELLAAIRSGAPLSFCAPLQGAPLDAAVGGDEIKKFEMSLSHRMRAIAKERAAAEGVGLVPWIRRLVALELAKVRPK